MCTLTNACPLATPDGRVCIRHAVPTAGEDWIDAAYASTLHLLMFILVDKRAQPVLVLSLWRTVSACLLRMLGDASSAPEALLAGEIPDARARVQRTIIGSLTSEVRASAANALARAHVPPYSPRPTWRICPPA